ncbi:MAG: NUDIX hydrolase, partial [Nitrospirota bacterium]
FGEETGFKAEGQFIALKPLKQRSGKIVHVWSFEGDCNPEDVRSNTFTTEWPPHSGKQAEFPEIDRAGWFTIQEAKEKIIEGQAGFLLQLEEILGEKRGGRD